MTAELRRRLRPALAWYRSSASRLPPRGKAPYAPDIASSLTEAECRRLAELAEGKVALELGSWLGRSTIALGSTAVRVHAVDWHRGDEHTGPLGTLTPFLRNITRYGVRDRVVVHVGRLEEVAPVLGPERFDLVFIDGFHTVDAVRQDIELLLPTVRDGGLLAFHDYGHPGYGVTEVVDALDAEPSVTDSIAVVRVTPELRARWAEISAGA
jgi:predicted O-methyltransferase YrrM